MGVGSPLPHGEPQGRAALHLEPASRKPCNLCRFPYLSLILSWIQFLKSVFLYSIGIFQIPPKVREGRVLLRSYLWKPNESNTKSDECSPAAPRTRVGPRALALQTPSRSTDIGGAGNCRGNEPKILGER